MIDERSTSDLASSARRATAFDRLDACAVVLDGVGTIVEENMAWRLFAQLNDGTRAATGRGVNYLEVCDRSAAAGAAGAAHAAAGLRQILSGERERFDLEYACPSPTEERWFLLQACAAPVADGAGAVMLHGDVTSRRVLSDVLATSTAHDGVTGLPSRTSAEGFLRDELVAAKQIRKAVWILHIAVDDRDTVSSLHGVHVGEALVVQVAARARAVLRAQDQLCSLARNELVLICPGLGRTDALRLAQRVRAVMAAPFQVGAVKVSGTVTVSVSESRVDSTIESLLGKPQDETATRRWPTIRRMDTDRGSGSPDRPQRADPRTANNARGAPERRADAAQTHSTDLVLCFGPDGTIEFASPASRQMLGWHPEDLVGLNGFDLIEPADHDTAAAAFASIPNLGDHVRVEFRVTDASGTTRWLEETATNLIDDPEVACIVGNLRDVTERVELLQTIEADRRRLADAQAAAKLGSFELNLDTLEIIRSDELWRMLGVEPGADPRTDLNFVHPDDRERVRAAIAQSLDGREHGECTYRIVRADGAVRWVLSQATRLGAPSSNRVIGTMLDITDRHEAESALNHQATHDWLTSLPNAASLHDVLGSAMAVAGPDARVAVAIVDLDHFKLVNDREGHAAGDEAIRDVAARLRRGMLDSDIVARLGGDEFVVVRTGVVALSGAAALGEQALDAVRDALTIGGLQVKLTVSVGVALSTATDSPRSLLQDADDAMYQSKRDGRNRLTVFDDSARARAHRARSISAALPLALERNELHLEYQPILDVATLQTVGFEAVLRWEHPDLGRIGPDEFIPLAEASGMILPIGDWVIDNGARQLAIWRRDARLPPALWLAINVSALQLAQPDLAHRLASSIERSGVPAAVIHLEITESVLMHRIDDAMKTIADLQAGGFRVSIDDFGTGYSSLSYLSRLSVDTIKIDRSFISGSTGGAHGWSIVRATIALASSLGLDVVAEGVESAGQLDMLRTLGCSYGQGFLWSRALRPDAALDWITNYDPSAHAARRPGATHPSTGGPDDLGPAVTEIARTAGRRRRTSAELTHVLRFDSLEIGLGTGRAWLAGRDLNLTTKEYELLRFLADRPGQVFSRNDLLTQVWKSSTAWQKSTTVTEHIHRLRNRIEADPRRPQLLTTVHGRGYCFGSPSAQANQAETA